MPKKKNKVVIPTALQMELLRVLTQGDSYGLEILDRINDARDRVSIPKLRIGSLYPTLQRLEEAKLVKGEFREEVAGPGTPRRKYYKILAEGKIAIKRAEAYQRLLEGNDAFEEEALPEFSFSQFENFVLSSFKGVTNAF